MAKHIGIEQLLFENTNLKKENERLKRDNITLKDSIIEKEKKINNLLRENKQSAELETKVKEWQLISGEIAHTIKTDVFNALNALDCVQQNISSANLASQHIILIRNLVELILLYLRRDRAVYSGKIATVNLGTVISERIKDVKFACESLPVSLTEHKLLLKELEPTIEITGDPIIYINDELSSVFTMIFNDLLRNAFTNTDGENPKVFIYIEQAETINIRISNNRLISDDDMVWFEKSIESASLRIPTSSKIGLRFIKKWGEYLGIKMFFSRDSENNLTTFNMQIPRRIEFE